MESAEHSWGTSISTTCPASQRCARWRQPSMTSAAGSVPSSSVATHPVYTSERKSLIDSTPHSTSQVRAELSRMAPESMARTTGETLASSEECAETVPSSSQPRVQRSTRSLPSSSSRWRSHISTTASCTATVWGCAGLAFGLVVEKSSSILSMRAMSERQSPSAASMCIRASSSAEKAEWLRKLSVRVWLWTSSSSVMDQDLSAQQPAVSSFLGSVSLSMIIHRIRRRRFWNCASLSVTKSVQPRSLVLGPAKMAAMSGVP
mmetsp:Transcript_7316/g.21656  ORF Transcript_7316/g.21656 Transcript_7316/m.21656 type:complete len:262 (-) Transcript_7316:213-998(-)